MILHITEPAELRGFQKGAIALILEQLVVAPPDSHKDIIVSVTVDVSNRDARLLIGRDGGKVAVWNAHSSLIIEGDGFLVVLRAPQRGHIRGTRQGFLQRFLKPKLVAGDA